MKFGMNPSPYFRSKRSTTQIMLEFGIGLLLVWICGIVYYFTFLYSVYQHLSLPSATKGALPNFCSKNNCKSPPS